MTFPSNPLLLLMTFLIIGLVSRYPKTRISDGGIILELTELFVCLAAVRMGLFPAILLIFLTNWIPLVSLKLEGPLEVIIRTIAMLIGLGSFYIVLGLGYPLETSILISTFVGMMIYEVVGFVITGRSYTLLLIMPFAKVAIYYKIMPLILCSQLQLYCITP